MLLECFLKLMQEFERRVFPQRRTYLRGKRLMLSGLLTIGRHWISRMISAAGRDQRDWSADYRIFSRSPWLASRLFEPVVRHTLELSRNKYVPVALDDTAVARAGRCVKAARWLRDALSPPFHVNLKKAVRFLHFSALVDDRQGDDGALCRGIPIHFEMVEVVKKPGKKATEEERKVYREEKKRTNLSMSTVQSIRDVRELFDRADGKEKILIMTGDGSFCNKTVMRAEYDRTILLTRTRKNAALCRPASPGGRRYYDSQRFSPEDVRKDEGIPWQTGSFFHGGKLRELRYKEVPKLLWQRGTGKSHVRLLVLAPTPYQLSPNSRMHFRDPAYLLTRDHECPAAVLIQSYVDRWQIEVNHRDMKDTLGLGEAQVWADRSVPRQPAFVVASYSLLLLAGLHAYGSKRTEDYEPLPKWRRRAARPSCLDLVTQLRKEAIAAPEMLEALDIRLHENRLVRKAAG